MKNFIKCECANVTLEFIAVVVALMLPTMYIATNSIGVAQTYMAQQSAARAAARAFVTSSQANQAQVRAKAVVRTILSDFKIPQNEVRTSIKCSNSRCLNAGAIINVTVSRNYVIKSGLPFGNKKIQVTVTQSAMTN